MVTLKESLTLAGENMLSNLSLDWDHFPFWSVSIGRDLRAKCNMDGPGHNVGRWWDAMLRLEAATGFAIPEPIEAAMLRNLEICLDNPFGLSGHTYGDSVRWVFYHSQRETMLALAVLARYRNSAWAAEAGATMIQAHNRFLRDDGMWDNEALQGIAAEHDIPLRKYKFAAHEKEGVYLTHLED